MDILDILLDILLKPPQPFIGLFFLTVISFFFLVFFDKIVSTRFREYLLFIVQIPNRITPFQPFIQVNSLSVIACEHHCIDIIARVIQVLFTFTNWRVVPLSWVTIVQQPYFCIFEISFIAICNNI